MSLPSTDVEVRPPWTWGDRIFEWRSFEPWRMVTSWCLPSSALAGARILVGLYQVAILLLLAATHWPNGAAFFTFWNFYTHLSYFSLTVYFLWSGIETAMYCRDAKRPLRVRLVHDSIFRVLYHVTMTSAVVVPLVYWVLLASSDSTLGALQKRVTNFSEHGVQGIFAGLDMALNNMDMSWKYVLWVVITVILFMCQTFVRNAAFGGWPYRFMDASKPINAAWYFGVLFIFIVVFFVLFGLHKLKVRTVAKPKSLV